MRNKRGYNFFFKTYRAALNGDLHSTLALTELAAAFLDDQKLPPPGLTKFLVRLLKDPERLRRILAFKPDKKRGRPSIDDESILNAVGFRTGKVFFGEKKSERYALAIAYLMSQGHPLNEAGTVEKESAAVMMSKLTRRSVRSLQDDYGKHKSKILKSKSLLQSGALEYKRLNVLARYKASRPPK
tara:strand:- start:765 stop:1319 length:555 start_codon:yes stop_codon:yes gene_type:complete